MFNDCDYDVNGGNGEIGKACLHDEMVIMMIVMMMMMMMKQLSTLFAPGKGCLSKARMPRNPSSSNIELSSFA